MRQTDQLSQKNIQLLEVADESNAEPIDITVMEKEITPALLNDEVLSLADSFLERDEAPEMQDDLEVSFQTLRRILKTSFFSAGSLMMGSGNMILAIPKFFEYYEINAYRLLTAATITAFTCTIQASALTKTYAVWQIFSPDKKHADNLNAVIEEIINGFRRRGVIGLLVCSLASLSITVSSMVVIGIRTFSGSDSFFKFIGVDNKTIRYAINSYTSLSGISTLLVFNLKIFFRNLFYAADNFGIPLDKKECLRITLNGLVSGVGQALIANYVLRVTVTEMGLNKVIGDAARDISVFVTSITSSGLFTLSRCIDIYKTETEKKRLRLNKESNEVTREDHVPEEQANKGMIQDISFAYVSMIGVLYAVAYYVITCTSLLDSEEAIGLSTEPRYIDLINLSFLGLAATIVEYEFMLSKMLETLASFFSQPKKATLTQIEPSTQNQESPILSPDLPGNSKENSCSLTFFSQSQKAALIRVEPNIQEQESHALSSDLPENSSSSKTHSPYT